MGRGDKHSRVHHVACVALLCGRLENVTGWDALPEPARAAASTAADHRPGQERGQQHQPDVSIPLVLPRCEGGVENAGVASASFAAGPIDARPSVTNLQFWDGIDWAALHQPVRVSRVVPDTVKPAIADLRKALADKVEAEVGGPAEESCMKALWFLDRLLFSTKRRTRGGRRGQHGETLARTLARRIRHAWAGQWGTLWEESAEAIPTGLGSKPSEAQRIARDIKAVQDALGNDDVREALRAIDCRSPMASDSKARRCLPHLFPQSPAQPEKPHRATQPEDVERFLTELRSAYRFAPRNRGSGPGGTLGEHWSWMPDEYADAFTSFEPIALRVALGRVPPSMLEAHLSARVLAADRPEENDKVRPLALGNFHRRQASKAVGKTFQTRVSTVLNPVEFSLQGGKGPECMHKTVLLDLDLRPDAVKISFDCSNAHKEFNRHAAIEAVTALVPDLLPWVSASLCSAAVHVHIGADGKHTELLKTRGGDQGDAITALTFPLTYRKVSAAVNSAAAALDPEAREYTFQDDLEQVCLPLTINASASAFQQACADVGLRSNLAKMCCSPGRNADINLLPPDLKVDGRAMVLKHGGGQALPCTPSELAASGSQLPESSPEVQHIARARIKFFERLRKLRAGGLQAQECQSLARHRTGGDFIYVARACGIPEADAMRLDENLTDQLVALLGFNASELDTPTNKRFFLAGRDGGLGFQSVQLTAAAAHAASWHTCLPKILQRLSVDSVSALVSASPWAARSLPNVSATFRAIVHDTSVEIGDPNAFASQHLMALAPLAAARDGVTTELASRPRSAAALRSAGGPGAFTWMLAPSEPAHHHSDAQFAISIRTRLGMAIPGCHGVCQHRRPNGEICGAALDQLGIHARYCSIGGWLVRRHDAARDVLGEWCEEHNCLVQREVTLPNAHPDRPEARMDLVVYSPGCSSPAYIDVSIVSALSQAALSGGAANHDGRASEIAARGKHKDYPLIPVTPFIVEDHGRFGDEAVKFIRRVAPAEPGPRSKAVRDLYHRLGALLQRHAADAVLSAIAVRPRRPQDAALASSSSSLSWRGHVGLTPATDVRLPARPATVGELAGAPAVPAPARDVTMGI